MSDQIKAYRERRQRSHYKGMVLDAFDKMERSDKR